MLRSVPSRRLDGGSDDQQQSYLTDEDGNAFDSYSLAWRYLGVFIDCELEDRRRYLEDAQGGGACPRRVLWAAVRTTSDAENSATQIPPFVFLQYHDPLYSGGSIGEYQMYDWETNAWNTTTCRTDRCARMDCHERGTHFQLVGVFIETEGLEDWIAQLFQHQGSCYWNNGDVANDGQDQQDEEDDDNIAAVLEQNNYQFMQSQRESWSVGCQEVEYNRGVKYYGVKPLSNGDVTFSLYDDADCRVEYTGVSLEDYTKSKYLSRGYYQGDATKAAEDTLSLIQRWNELMGAYKVCQPCRAFSKTASGYERRKLGSEDEGEDEQWGFNCYDSAGSLNVDQCYEFEAETAMKLASAKELERAALQGTILPIQVDGVKIGSEGPWTTLINVILMASGVLSCCLGSLLVFWVLRKIVLWCSRRGSGEWKVDLLFAEEPFDSSETEESSDEMTSSDDDNSSDEDSDGDSLPSKKTLEKMDGTFTLRRGSKKPKQSLFRNIFKRATALAPVRAGRKLRGSQRRLRGANVKETELTSAEIADIVAKQMITMKM